MTNHTIKVKIQRRPVLKFKVLPRFPASVTADSPITLDRTGGNYLFGIDIAELTVSLGGPYQPLDADLTALAATSTDGQLAIGQTSANPLWKTITGDWTLTAAGATAIGATKVTNAMLNADVFSTAHTWSAAQTLTLNQNAPTNWVINNNSAGASSAASFGVNNGTGNGGFGIGGTGYTDFTALANRAYVFAGTASDGIAIFTQGADPINFYAAGVLAGAFSGAGIFSLVTPLAITSGGTGANSASTARTALGLEIGTNVQAFDADLAALAANSTDGLWAHTGAGTGAARTLTAPAAGLTISNPAGIAGNPTFALANDLAAVEGLSGTGIARRTGTDAWSVGTAVANSELANSSVTYGSTAVALGASSTVIDGLTRLNLTSGSNLNWNSDAYIGRAAAAKAMLGQADAASAVSQTLSVQNVVAGTSNTAGAAFNIAGSQGTGTGLGGAINLRVAPGGGSGTSQNALVTGAALIPSATANGGMVWAQGVGPFTPWTGSVAEWRTGTDQRFSLAGANLLASGVAFQVFNDAISLNLGLEFRASQVLFSQGGVTIGNAAAGIDPGVGSLNVAGHIASGLSTTKTLAYSLVTTDSSLIFNGAGSITLTLQAASSYSGRWLHVKTIAAQTVISASSNVVPLVGGAAGTAILAATAGKWALLQSDGTNWVIMQGN